MAEMSPRQAITGFFMFHWGFPRQFHVQEPDPFELAVVEFGPGRQWGPMKSLGTSRFATNGMYAYLQCSPDYRYRTELYACSRSSDLWIIQLMAGLARYPLMQETRLGEFDTIPSTQSIRRGKTTFTAFLLAPPGPKDSETLGVIGEVTPEPILVHQVVAITQAEYEFALEHLHGERLWERLVSLGQPLLLDEARPDAVLGR